MANETYYYFGAYLKITVNEIEIKEFFIGCKNGHSGGGNYCQTCGEPVGNQSRIVTTYPTWIYDELLDDPKWEDVLSVMTPPSLYKTGVIIAKGNLSKPRGEWIVLNRWDDSVQIKDFPSESEITEMKNQLQDNYIDVISALQELDSVALVEVKAGYVMDAEY